MLCSSSHCPKYNECIHACINNFESRYDQVEDLYSYGYGIYTTDKCETHSVCGFTGNYAMFVPKNDNIYDKLLQMIKDMEPHQITIEEWLEEKEKNNGTF